MRAENDAALPPEAASVVNSLPDTIPRRRSSPLYLLGLAAVAAIMFLLVVAYVAAVGLLGYGIYYYATRYYSHFMDSESWLDIAGLYLAPLVIGCVWLVFMVKPLFARSARPPKNLELTREEEPALFAFIERLCRCTGAPMPRKIEVYAEANAQAGFRRGWRSFLGQDLTLRLGLPLVAGLNVQQFTQVAAHELGHFTQGAGMRLRYMIGRINGWLHRVVHERDRLDLMLQRNADRSELTIFVPLRIAQQCVWLSRRVLWMWLQAGRGVSCFFSRQGELDADALSCQLVGSSSFGEGHWRTQLLGQATKLAFESAQAGWKNCRLPDDLPEFAVRRAEAFSAEEVQEMRKAAERAKNGWFDTHPSWPQRSQAAVKLGAPGVFRRTEPAGVLFCDLPALCRSTTRHFYESERGLKLEDGFLIPTQESLAEHLAQVESSRALDRYLEGLDTFFYPVVIHADELKSYEEVETLRLGLVNARERLHQSREATAEAVAKLKRLDERLMAAINARAQAESGIKIKPREFGVASTDPDEIGVWIKALEQKIRPLETAAAEFSRGVKLRLETALQLLHHPEGVEGLRERAALREESGRLAEALGRLVSTLWLMHEVRRSFPAFEALIAKRPTLPNPVQLDRVLDGLVRDCQLVLKKVKQHLYSAPYPFLHARGQITLETFLKTECNSGDQIADTFRECEAHLDRLFFLYYRTLARLAEIGEQVEKAMV